MMIIISLDVKGNNKLLSGRERWEVGRPIVTFITKWVVLWIFLAVD